MVVLGLSAGSELLLLALEIKASVVEAEREFIRKGCNWLQ